MEIGDDDIKRLIKQLFPKSHGGSKDRVCPTEEELASFVDGKLKGKKEGDLFSHLAVCKDCLETIRFLRQEPSAGEIPVPRWLDQKVKEIFPVKPRKWEIVFGGATHFLEIIKHNADLGLTLPEMEVVPSAATFLSKTKKVEPPVTEKPLSYVPGKYQKPAHRDTWKGFQDIVGKDKTMGKLFDVGEEVLFEKKRDACRVIESIRDPGARGFVFQERMGDYSVYLFLTKKEEAETVDLQIEILDSSGESAEEMEILFLEGRKVLKKLFAGKDYQPMSMPRFKRLHIKFKQKGIYLGEAVLDSEGKGGEGRE